MAAPAEEYLAVLRAAYDYNPQSEDEVAIKESQIVFLLEKTDDDWWKVKIKADSQDEDAPSGLVPAAYVEPAPHTSTVKALYDYSATAPGELSIVEDEILLVFNREEEWLLVQSQNEGGKAGFVPGNYIEEVLSEPTSIQHIPSTDPPARSRPVSVYVDPADLVAQTSAKAQADDIKTWAVSEVDKRGKKKKGTLGVGNGTFFFASESDKTPVQKWKTTDVRDIVIEKQKHVHVDVGGNNPIKLHFAVGNKEVSEAIVHKLESSRGIHSSTLASEEADERADTITPPPYSVEAVSPSKKNGASVRFTDESPEIIPPREPSEDGDEGIGVDGNADQEDRIDGEPVVVLYDFQGSSPDELSVQEGEPLWVIDKEGEEWWKCRNEEGLEGVVPASYLESTDPSATLKGNDIVAGEEEVRIQAERQEREREQLAQEAQKRIDAERKAKERKKAEEEQRAKAALAAEAEKKRREKEEAATAAEAQRKRRQEAAKRAQQKAEREQSNSPRPASAQIKPSRESTSSTRRSNETIKSGPAPGSTRTWHDRTGQFRVEAALLGYSNGKLRLHKVNGVVIEVSSEKMSVEDMRYVERLMARKTTGSGSQSARRWSTTDEDDKPLALKRQSEAPKKAAAQPNRGIQIDWFDFFLSAGCDVDDCTRYATSFERDKIDETILPDITESTMRLLGLREGDIIRVNKVIQQKYAKTPSPTQDQISRDKELAQKSQEEENGKKSTPSPAPNLFAGPGGLLKNNTQRRGRPQPSKSLPPPAVDMDTIGSALEQIKRTGSPLVTTTSPISVVPERPSSTATGAKSGFDDDAWTNRPGAKSSSTPAPLPTAPRPLSAPPESQTAIPPPPAPAPPILVSENQSQESKTGLAKTDADIFDQLARLSQLRTNRTAPSPAPISAPATITPVIASSPPPPPGYNNGLGMGASPVPLAQHLLSQQTGALSPQHNTPRGPFAPVPANQSLLQPLVPTTTGFSSFVPTRAGSVLPHSFLQPQPTSLPGNPQHLVAQPTGFPASSPILTQPTGVSTSPFGNTYATTSSIPNMSTRPVSTNPTGLSPFGQSTFNSMISTPSPTPSLPYPQPPNGSNPSTSPANIFAQMKSGTFATDDHAVPQQADKYDALRVNPQPTGFVPQATGWGFQSSSGYQSGYTGY
ncbi:hypothetical protein J3A83DRAFT_4223634 [Scleroderma citrinum]